MADSRQILCLLLIVTAASLSGCGQSVERRKAVPAEQLSSEATLETQDERQSLKVAVPDRGSLQLDLNLADSTKPAADDGNTDSNSDDHSAELL